MESQAIAYYKWLREQWVIGGRDEQAPVLNKVSDDKYQLGRGNDLGIDVDLFIAGHDEYHAQSVQAEEITNPFLEATDAVWSDYTRKVDEATEEVE